MKGIESEDAFETVFPLDNTADESGMFKCGKSKTEGKRISIPMYIDIQKLILRLTWVSGSESFHSHSNILNPTAHIHACLNNKTATNIKSCMNIFSNFKSKVS